MLFPAAGNYWGRHYDSINGEISHPKWSFMTKSMCSTLLSLKVIIRVMRCTEVLVKVSVSEGALKHQLRHIFIPFSSIENSFLELCIIQQRFSSITLFVRIMNIDFNCWRF